MTDDRRVVCVLAVIDCRDVTVNMDVFGEMRFEKGLWVYVGSVQKCLKRRVEWHLRKTKCRFRHIDGLLGNSAVWIQKVFCKKACTADECPFKEALSERGVPMRVWIF